MKMKKQERVTVMKKAETVNTICAVIYAAACIYTLIVCAAGFFNFSLMFVTLIAGILSGLVQALFLPQKKSHSVVFMCSLIVPMLPFLHWAHSGTDGFSSQITRSLLTVLCAATVIFTVYSAFLSDKSECKPVFTNENGFLEKIVKLLALNGYLQLCIYTAYSCLFNFDYSIEKFLDGIKLFDSINLYFEGDGVIGYALFLLPFGLLACAILIMFARKQKLLSSVLALTSLVQFVPLIILYNIIETKWKFKALLIYGFVSALASAALAIYLAVTSKKETKITSA